MVLLLLLALVSSGCAGLKQPVGTEAPALSEPMATQALSYTDPFAYCAAVGTVDAPDERYTGPQISDEIVEGFIAAADLEKSTEPLEMFKQSTIWRCMDGQVMACNFGANLPCSAKANTDERPTKAMAAYCKDNPGAEFIPMYVTGHETIYSFHCVQDQPELLEQIAEVDVAGFLAGIWYPISAEANP